MVIKANRRIDLVTTSAWPICRLAGWRSGFGARRGPDFILQDSAAAGSLAVYQSRVLRLPVDRQIGCRLRMTHVGLLRPRLGGLLGLLIFMARKWLSLDVSRRHQVSRAIADHFRLGGGLRRAIPAAQTDHVVEGPVPTRLACWLISRFPEGRATWARRDSLAFPLDDLLERRLISRRPASFSSPLSGAFLALAAIFS